MSFCCVLLNIKENILEECWRPVASTDVLTVVQRQSAATLTFGQNWSKKVLKDISSVL